MLQAPVTISQQASALKEKLTEWAQPKGGRVAVMANQRHLWEELTDLPQAVAAQSPRIMVLCAGADLLMPGEPDCRREDRRWQIVLVKGRGFYKDPMSGGPAEPFTDSVEAVRDLVRCMIGISDLEEVPSVRYQGWKPLPSILPTREANAFADAVVLEFITSNDIPQIVLEAPGTEQLDGSELQPE
jgi:hypothetical protein